MLSPTKKRESQTSSQSSSNKKM